MIAIGGTGVEKVSLSNSFLQTWMIDEFLIFKVFFI
jgi:hypothetical protein